MLFFTTKVHLRIKTTLKEEKILFVIRGSIT